jgi:hypothetical protein
VRWRFLLLVFGISLIVLGCREIMLWRIASDRPQVLRCADLGRNGPRSNAHVLLCDFRLCDSAFVYEERRGQWTQAWVPAVPRYEALDTGPGAAPGGAGPPAAPAVRVLVKMPRARSVADVVQAARQETLQGMVVNAIERLGRVERATLERSYPEVDFDACWILELDRRPAGFAAIVGSLGGGAALILFVLWASLGGQTPELGPRPAPAVRTAGGRSRQG